MPAAGSDDWALNQVREFVYPVQVVMWFRQRDIRPAEEAIEHVIRAIFDDNTGVNPILDVTGQYPKVSSFTVAQGLLADQTTRVMIARLGVTLTKSWHPQDP